MSTSLPHARAKFTRDATYIRAMLRDAEAAIKAGDWSTAEAALQEIAGVASTNSEWAYDNAHGLQDARYHLAYK